MSKTSVVTVREKPMALAGSASGSGLTICAETITVATDQRLQLLDLTSRVAEHVRGSGVREGTASVWSLHTTCALLVNEYQQALLADIARVLEELVARDGAWMHNDPKHSDCDRVNADSHLRAMLLGHSLTLQVSGGELVLGQFQRILLAELDGPRTRSLRIQISGLA